MTFDVMVCFVCGAAMGGFINGFAGFGTALMSLGLWLQVLPAWQAVAIVAVMSVVSGVQSLWLIRAAIAPGLKRLPYFLIPALISLPIGTFAIVFLNVSVIKLILGALMLVYGVFFLLKAQLPKMNSASGVGDVLVGLIGGFLGGVASLSGPIPTMWCAMKPWTKHETSAVLRPFNVTVLGIASAVYFFKGYYTQETLFFMLAALPITLIFSQLGVFCFRKLTDTQYRCVLVAMMFLSGASLLIRELIL